MENIYLSDKHKQTILNKIKEWGNKAKYYNQIDDIIMYHYSLGYIKALQDIINENI